MREAIILFDNDGRTFFQKSDAWPLADSADPIDGWAIKDVMDTSVGNLVNDVYGKLYFYVKDVLSSFCRRVQALKISFNLFQADAESLIDCLSPGTFARIEVGQQTHR
jgi:hypothetical protein